MTEDDSTVASTLIVARHVAACAGSVAVKKNPLAYGLWMAVFMLAGGMLLFLITVRHVLAVY